MSILEELTLKRKLDSIKLEKIEPLGLLEKIIEELDYKKKFSNAFKTKEINIIAEIKKASPSKGIISNNFRPLYFAKNFKKNGAKAISILCEPHKFLGYDLYLKVIKNKINIPILYKDFISTRYQIARAKILGADCILLIVKAVKNNLKDLLKIAKDYKIEVLVETHSIEEIDIALDLEVKMIGINSRNLDNFKTNISIIEKLLEKIPENIIKIAESGIKTKQDLLNLYKLGANGFLIGEIFMRENNPEQKLKEFLS